MKLTPEGKAIMRESMRRHNISPELVAIFEWLTDVSKEVAGASLSKVFGSFGWKMGRDGELPETRLDYIKGSIRAGALINAPINLNRGWVKKFLVEASEENDVGFFIALGEELKEATGN